MNMSCRVYGLIEVVFVLGMIVGGIVITFKSDLFSMKKLHKTMHPIVIAIIIMGVAASLNRANVIFSLGLYLFGGFGIMLSLALSNILSLTYIQQEVKRDMLGKVSAFSTAVATVSVTPGQLTYGQLIESNFSIPIILMLTTLFSIGVVLFIKWNVRDI